MECAAPIGRDSNHHIDMRPSSRRLLAALLVPLFSPLAASDIVEVWQQGMGFNSNDLTINVGDTVRWIWTSDFHTVTEGTDGNLDGSEAFHSLLSSGTPVFDVTFDAAFLAQWPRPGNRYDYVCIPHITNGMVGVITVEAGPGSTYCYCDGTGGTPPCGNYGQGGAGCRNSTIMFGAVLFSNGTSSASADDLGFQAVHLIPSQPALLFAGTTSLNGGNGVHFGDGLRCAGGTVVRLGVRVPDTAGVANWGAGLGATGGWSSGDTRMFQVWYRDPSGGWCGSGFNLTTGNQVTFAP
jgi:plastocyanin